MYFLILQCFIAYLKVFFSALFFENTAQYNTHGIHIKEATCNFLLIFFFLHDMRFKAAA